MTDFSSGHEGNVPPKQFRPGPGQVGVNAAMHQPKGGPKEVKGKAGASSRPAQRIGAPSIDQEPSETTHLYAAIEHEAARTLGRDLPYALWAQRNGANEQPYHDYLSE